MRNIMLKLLVGMLILGGVAVAQVISFDGPETECTGNPDCNIVLQLKGINNQGQVVGYWFVDGGVDRVQSVIVDIDDRTFTNIPLPPTSSPADSLMFVDKINNGGQVVGTLVNLVGGEESTRYGVLGNATATKTFQIGEAVLNASINDLGDIAGTFLGHTGRIKGFYKSSLGCGYNVIVFPGSKSTIVTDVNNSGDIVGRYSTGTEVKGFVRKAGQFTSIDVPGANEVYPYGINNSGEIVGGFFTAGNYVYHGFKIVNGVLEVVDVGTRAELQDVNDAGEIVGEGEGLDIGIGSFLINP